MTSRTRVTRRQPQFGQQRSHALNITKRTFKLNMQTKRYFIPELDRWVKLRLTANDMKTVDKVGISAYLKERGFNAKQLVD
jgi:large subunit ribosomal protein L28